MTFCNRHLTTPTLDIEYELRPFWWLILISAAIHRLGFKELIKMNNYFGRTCYNVEFNFHVVDTITYANIYLNIDIFTSVPVGVSTESSTKQHDPWIPFVLFQLSSHMSYLFVADVRATHICYEFFWYLSFRGVCGGTIYGLCQTLFYFINMLNVL